MRPWPRLHRIAAASAGVFALGFATGASAQDVTSVDTEMTPPMDTPGIPRGPRERPAAEAPAPATTTEEPPEWIGGKPWWEWSRMTGNWGGLRTRLEDSGLTFSGSYTLNWSSVWSGGEHNRASTRSLLDFNLTFDTKPLLGIEGGTAFVDFISTDMRGLDDPGDLNRFDGFATDKNDDELAEFWYEQYFFDKLLRIKLGKIDANTEFAFVDGGGDFTHGDSGVTPTILNLPTYPDPSVGISAFVYPAERFYAGIGFFDGAAGDGLRTGGHGFRTAFSDDKSSDWFFIGEAGLTWSECCQLGAGRVGAGVWHHTGDFARFDGGNESDGSTGFYCVLDQQLLRRGESVPEGQEDPNEGKGLFAFGQFGWADEDIAEICCHIGGGLTLRGTFAGRDEDAAGLYVSWADFSDSPGAGLPADQISLELFYKCTCTPACSIKPTLSYVTNPSSDPSIDDAVVGLVQFVVNF